MNVSAMGETLWLANEFPRSVWATELVVIVPMTVMVAGALLIGMNVFVTLMLAGIAATAIVGSLLDMRRSLVPCVGISPDALLLRRSGGRTASVSWRSVVSLEGPLRGFLTHVPCYILCYRSTKGRTTAVSFSSEVGSRLIEELEMRAPSGVWPEETEPWARV